MQAKNKVPRFTKRHYVVLAEALHKARNGHPTAQLGLAIGYLTEALAADNPRFDAEHFRAVVRGEREVNSRPKQKRSMAHLAVPVAGLSCECSDSGCKAHKGSDSCSNPVTSPSSVSILYRIDMQDETGTAMCDACADDAFSSGLFTTREAQQ